MTFVFMCPACDGHGFGSRSQMLDGSPAVPGKPGMLRRGCHGCNFEWSEEEDFRHFRLNIEFKTRDEYEAACRFESQLIQSVRRVTGETDHGHTERVAGLWMDRSAAELTKEQLGL